LANTVRECLFFGRHRSESQRRKRLVASRAGFEAFTATLRREVAGRAIKVSVLQPGPVDADMQECSSAEKREAVARYAKRHAEKVADAIAWLLAR
jgi:3-hydroxy acid dehydrogenase/malonic semialdehyde reductase